MMSEHSKSSGRTGTSAWVSLGLAGLLWSACNGGEEKKPTLQVYTSGMPTAGKPVEITLRLFDGQGEPVRKFETMHEKQVHLLIMSRDLDYFAHEHPQPMEGGALGLVVTFPTAGEYVLFGDYKPEGGRITVSSSRLTVQGTGVMKDPDLRKDDLSQARRKGDFEVKLDQEVHGSDSMLSFTMTRGGKPVSELHPYLGARGHLVIVDPGASTLLHSHPIDSREPGKVAFHARFPSPGLYKLWAEFRPEGKPLLVDFVIEVTEAGRSRHAH